MLTLALETATQHTSVAVVEEGRELAAWREMTHHDLCRRLAHEAARALADAGRSFGELGLVAVGLGPGSFTSVRVGLATAKGFALGRELPLVGVPSFAAMAWQVRESRAGLVCPVVDAKRGELYAGLFRLTADSVTRESEEWVMSAPDLAARLEAQAEPVTVVGEAAQLAAADAACLEPWLHPQPVWPDAMAIAVLAARRLAAGERDKLSSLRPIYVRMSYAEESRKLDLGLR